MVIFHNPIRLLVLMTIVGIFVWMPMFSRAPHELAFYPLAEVRALPAKIGFLSRLSNISLSFLMLKRQPAPHLFISLLVGRKYGRDDEPK